MTTPKLEQRVESLEDLMAALIRSGERLDRQIAATDRQIAATDRQIAATDQQIAATGRQMADTDRRLKHLETLVDCTQRQVDQTSREMAEFKQEMRADRKDMNRKWGELANRLGTMAEDLVAPSVPRVVRQVLGTGDAPIDSAVRVRRHLPGDPATHREFDVVATCGDYLLVNETKSRLSAVDVARFAKSLPNARAYFPEHADKGVVGVIASLYVDPAVARHAEARGLIVLGFGEDVMDVLNSPGFVPRSF